MDVADVVLEGGGVKGLALVGALQALHDHGYRFGSEGRVAGTSAGAIVGSLLAAGMPVPEAVDLMRKTDLRRFQDDPPFGPIGKGAGLLFRLSLHSGDELHRWIEGSLAERNVRTFRDLRLNDPKSDLADDHAYKLVVIVSDVTSGRMIRLPWDYRRYGLAPDEQPVADAVRASAAIPFFFRPVEVPIEGQPPVVFTDGGMLSNYPITIFDRKDGKKPRWPTFGIRLSSPPNGTSLITGRKSIAGPISLLKALVDTTVSAHDRMIVDEPAIQARTIFADPGDIRATDFDLPRDAQDRLFESGRRAGNAFLNEWDFEEYLASYRQPVSA
ncbi:patatin-like phospholipase family protein [Nonomuraea sp. NPDC003201]